MPLREDLLTPIAGPNRAGTYLRYDPLFDKIKEARREDLDVPQGGYETTRKTADWPLVVKLTSETLATKSKDLQLAVWLTEAALKREGYGGLREGLDVLRGLLEEYWAELYPELEDDDAEFRAAPLEWLGQYLDVAIKSMPLNREGHTAVDYHKALQLGYEADYQNDRDSREAWQQAIAEGRLSADAFDAAVEATPKAWYKEQVAGIEATLESLEELDRVSEEKFGSDAPSYLKLRQALQEVLQVLNQFLKEKLAKDPDPVEEPVSVFEGGADSGAGLGTPAGGEAAVTGTGGAVAGIAISAVPSSRDEATSRIATAARYLRKERLSDPAAYLLLRGFRWGELRGPGDVPAEQLLVAPPTEARSRLKKLLLDEQWTQLLEAAEEVMAMPYGRGWLDLQRYVMTACEGLGEEYDPLADALRSALRSLLHDLPWLTQATLMDDTATANADTLAWLRSEGLLGEPRGRSSDDTEAETPPRIRLAGRRDVMDAAAELVRARKPQQAVELLMQHAAQERSERARFLRRLQAATIMVEAGLTSVATPMLEDMVEQITKHDLENWEDRETVAQPLALLYRCKQAVAEYEGDPDTQALFLRVARLDPMQGIRLTAVQSNGGSE
jgi:type VI secretion system protein ImpA